MPTNPTHDPACRLCGCTDQQGCCPSPGNTYSCAWVAEADPHPLGPLCTSCERPWAVLVAVTYDASGFDSIAGARCSSYHDGHDVMPYVRQAAAQHRSEEYHRG